MNNTMGTRILHRILPIDGHRMMDTRENGHYGVITKMDAYMGQTMGTQIGH